jgi:hypothetical protein
MHTRPALFISATAAALAAQSYARTQIVPATERSKDGTCDCGYRVIMLDINGRRLDYIREGTP